MTSRLRAPSRRPRLATPVPLPARLPGPAALAGRLAVAVLAAALLVAVLEAAVLDVTVLQNSAGGRSGGSDRWHVVDVLAGGAAFVVPLTLVFGGWRLVRGHVRALQELAVDDLTGVRSRRAFAADLPDAVRAAAGSRQPLTLALVELAGVPAAVELLGRRRTEVLVCAAAATLAAPPRPAAAVAPATYRLAGDVFAVVLPGVGPDAAFEVVDGLLGQVARTAAPLSAGAGLATLDARCPDAQLLLVGASAALDEARGLGGGRVVASAEEGTGLRWIATSGHPEAG
jgi:GGDEF domain-containing protein